VWWFDASAAPGWADYLGLALTVLGFWIAIAQLHKTRTATEAATDALREAQANVSHMAFMSVIPQIQMVVDDLSFAMPANDEEVARRALVRFSLLGREASEILESFDADHRQLQDKLVKASTRATKTKSALVTTKDPDVIAVVKVVAADIDAVHQELAQVGAQLRNRIGGSDGVHR
jgi:hypothetical protein